MSDYAAAVQNYTESSPIAKDDPVSASDQIPKLRDFRPVTQENLDGDTLRFFPPNPSNRDSVTRNYEDNPLPRNTSKKILAIGFAFNKLSLEGSTGVDPLGVINNLSHAEVRVETDQGRTIAKEHHIKRYLDSKAIEHERVIAQDGSNVVEHVTLPVEPLFRVDDCMPLTIGPDERFEFEVELRETSAIPAAADTDLKMGAFLQVRR